MKTNLRRSMMIKKPLLRLLSGLAFAVVAVTAQAAPVALGSGSFLSTDTLIDFNSASNEVAIGPLYSGSGVTFSGALLGMTTDDVVLFPNNGGGGAIASNFDYAYLPGHNFGSTGQSFTATFSSTVYRVGFLLENDPSQIATIELFNGTSSLGTLALAQNSGIWPNLTPEFRGFGDASGFDTMVFTNSATNDGLGFFAIDDMRFSAAAAIPEPEIYAMMAAGLGLMGFIGRRRKLQIAS